MITMFEGFSDDEINQVANMVSVTSDLPNPTQNYKQANPFLWGTTANSRRVIRAKRKNETYRTILSAKDSNLPAPKEEEEYEEEEHQTITFSMEPSERASITEVASVKEESSMPEMAKEDEKNDQKEVSLTEVPSILTSQSLMHQPLSAKLDNLIKNAAVSVDLEDGPSFQTLIEFEETQKKLEAFNLQRKEQLRQALSDRVKKTNEEVKKINQIEEELKKLDSSLSNDVCILRNQIELASHEFMEAQKRFNKAEKEYVEAKIELYSKKERKELLTSHLCSIIEQNELRKAKKLSDLMEKLEVPSKPEIIEKVESRKASEIVTEKNVT